jgi:hypothetical protein
MGSGQTSQTKCSFSSVEWKSSQQRRLAKPGWVIERKYTNKAIEASIESHIGLSPSFLMGSTPNAPVDQVGHFQDNY